VKKNFEKGEKKFCLGIYWKGKIVAGDKGFKDQLTGMDFVFVKGGGYEMGDPLTTFFRRSFTTDFFPYFFIDIFCKQR
jgi:hypothetical protein